MSWTVLTQPVIRFSSLMIKEENVNAARVLGIRAFIFGESTVLTLLQMSVSPVSKAGRYLSQNAKQCDSITSTGVSIADNFAKLLIVDTLPEE